MKLRFTVAIAVLFLGLAAFSTKPVNAQKVTALGITQEEINIWNQRRVSGPYRVAGDVSTNSPGDWSRIQSNADSFLSNPSAENWSGQTSDSCWVNSTSSPVPGRAQGEKIRDAGFVYLLTGNTTYRDAVLARLLAQAATAGTNFTNTTRWNQAIGCAAGDTYSWNITNWATRLAFAYDYIRHSISAGNRSTLDTWFNNAGVFWEENAHRTVLNRYPGRLNDDYTLASGWDSCSGSQSPKVLYFGGPNRCSFMEGWANRGGSHVRLAAATSLITGNTTLQNRVKRWFHEAIKYTVWADGTHQEFHRWTSTIPAHGWAYVGTIVGILGTIADLFARTGDTSLYEFSTTVGQKLGSFTDTSGGPKSLRQAITLFLRHVNGAVVRYGTNQSANNGNPNYRVRSEDGLYGAKWVQDTYFTNANVYFNDSEIKSIYLRQAAGAPAYPSSPSSGGYCVWCGEWGIYPGVLFMFGQMEGKLSPYPRKAVSASAPAPSNSPIGHWKFDEGSGTVAKDSSGTGNHATLTNGATWTTGRSGSAVSFDGLDDFVKIAATNFATTQGTFAAWIRASIFKSSEQYIFGHTSIPAYGSRLQLYTDDSGGHLDMGIGSSHTSALNIQQLQTNTWHHVVLTWSSGTFTVYVNGIQKTTGPYSGLINLNSYAHIGGGGLDSNPQSWAGAIDEVKIWNRALSTTEVQNEYNSYQLLPPEAPSNIVAQPAAQ